MVDQQSRPNQEDEDYMAGSPNSLTAPAPTVIAPHSPELEGGGPHSAVRYPHARVAAISAPGVGAPLEPTGFPSQCEACGGNSLRRGQEVNLDGPKSPGLMTPGPPGGSGERIVGPEPESQSTQLAYEHPPSDWDELPFYRIQFDPTGLQTTPREPENLHPSDQAVLSELMERRAQEAGRPCRIQGTLAQVKPIEMLLDTGAACCIMPYKTFMDLQKLKPTIDLVSTTRCLIAVEGHPLHVRGTATVDVEIAGRYALTQFTIVQEAQEVILGMDFLRMNGATWDVSSNELCFEGGTTVFAQRAITAPEWTRSRRVLLVKEEVIPPTSQVAVKVMIAHRKREPMPAAGLVSPIGSVSRKFGIVTGSTLIDPRAEFSYAVVLNPRDEAVILPRLEAVGIMHPIGSIQTLPECETGGSQGSSVRDPSESEEEAWPSDEEEEVADTSNYWNDSRWTNLSGDDGLPEPTPRGECEEEEVLIGTEPPSNMPTWSCRIVTEPNPEAVSQTDDKSSDPSPLPGVGRTAPEEILSTTANGNTPDPEDGSVPQHLLDLYSSTAELLTEEERHLLRGVLWRNADMWARNSQDLGSTDITTHTIDTGDHPPIKIPARRVPLHKQEAMTTEVEKMLDKGIIEPCDGPWSSPVVLAAKKDGSLRFCIDYRKLNEVTKKDAYPLPRIEDNLDALSGSKWFSTLDLLSGFWQVEMAPEDKSKTAFTVGRGGLYQFLRMPFGLCNAPATFQRLMEKVLAGLQWEYAVLYIDDIVVFGPSVGVALDRLQIVLDRLRQAGLRLKPSKCTLLKPEVDFLGHTVSAQGVGPDPKKIQAVVDWETPTDLTQLRSFIGLCTYYRRFVKGFSDICKPLYLLLEKGLAWRWGDEQQKAFDAMKKHLTEAPILAYPNPHDKFVLDTDASAFGIGAVLSQVQNGVERVIAYGSRTLNKAERNYCVTRRELLAIVYFVKEFHHYLVGAEFLLRTDHAALYWLFGMKDLEGQPARWVERLNTYNMVIQHRPGKKHLNADALSRCHVRCYPRCKEVREESFTTGVQLPFSNFQSIREVKWANGEDYGLVPSDDEEWSDEEWEQTDDPPLPSLYGEAPTNEGMLSEADYVINACFISRVLTRARARERDAPPPVAAGGVDPPEGEAPRPPPQAEYPTAAEIVELQNQQQFLKDTPVFDWTEAEIAYMQGQDADVAKIRDIVKSKKKPDWQVIAGESKGFKAWWGRFDQMFMSENGVLYVRWVRDQFSAGCPENRVVTPRALQPYIMKELHDIPTAGHLGLRKTCHRVFKSRFYWPGMGATAKRWVRNCLKCGARKKPKFKRRTPMSSYHVGNPMERVSIDILGPFKPRTKRGHSSILTVTDQFTRWVEAFPLRRATADKIAYHVVDFLCRKGICKDLLSDQGANVRSGMLKEICRLLGSRQNQTCAYHPQGNSITERENKVICDMLSHYVNTRATDWDDFLPPCMFAYRTSVHRTLGETPAMMMFGRELNMPLHALVGPPPEKEYEEVYASDYVNRLSEAMQDVHEVVRTRLDSYYRYESLRYDRKASVNFYYVGQAVWVFSVLKTLTRSKKIMQPWTGPYIVIGRVSDVVYAVQMKRGVVRCLAGNRLKPYHALVEEPFMKALWTPAKDRPPMQ